ncbi:MAG: AraC family transcriptional regulator, partial [Ferruginibacter sp.]
MSLTQNQKSKYLVANDEDERWGIFVTTIGFQTILPNTDYPPKGHPSSHGFNAAKGRVLHEYQIIYIIKGEGVFQSSSCKPTKVFSGTVILLFPEEWHTYKPVKNTGWDAYWIGFDGSNIYNLLLNNFFSITNPVLDIGFNEQIAELYKHGLEIANFQKAAYQQMIAGIVQMLLSHIFYAEKNNSFRDKLVVSLIEKARVIMRDNITNNQTTESVAAELNMSYSWFRRIFKQYTGFSPGQYQMEIKLQKAKELLTGTVMLVKEICFELNFESVSYFVTFFKLKTGMSPTE